MGGFESGMSGLTHPTHRRKEEERGRGGRGEIGTQTGAKVRCKSGAVFVVDEINVACFHFGGTAKHGGPHVPPGKAAKCHGWPGQSAHAHHQRL